MKKLNVCVCFVLLFSATALCDDMRIADLVDVDRIAEKLGDGWRRDAGVVLEGEDDITKMSESLRRKAKRALENLKPKGITGFGNYSFTRTIVPINNVTILVQKFSSADKAAAYGELKYGGQKQKSRYKKSVTRSEVTYDNLLWKRRVVVHGRFIVTAEHAQKRDLHAEILKECINFDGKKKKDVKEKPKPPPVKKGQIQKFKDYGFAIKGSGKLVTLDASIMKYLAGRVNYGVVMHAKKKGVDAGKVKSDILFYQSLHKIDAGKDNPNIIVSVENNWLAAKDPSGKDYLELIADRIKTFKMPSAFTGKMEKKVIGGKVFYVQDVLNTRIKGADTKQKYYATYHKGNYITFVVSYNAEKSETFKSLESVLQSFNVPGESE